MTVIYLSIIFGLLCVSGYLLFSYIKERKLFDYHIGNLTETRPNCDLNYFCLFDNVRGEMILSPFQSHNYACCIRQVQELVQNKSIPLPKDLSELELVHLYSMDSKSLKVLQPSIVHMCKCDDDSLKHAYQRYKEVK